MSSRHELEARADLPEAFRRATIAIGWDGPLQTFYVIVNEDEADDPAIWVGTATREITDADAALRHVAPWAIVPGGLRAELIAEQQGDQRSGRHPFAIL
jgi:hypothetical protein